MTPDTTWLASDEPLELPRLPDLPAAPMPLAPGETATARLVLLEREEAAYRARHGFDGPGLGFCNGDRAAWSPSTRLWLALRAAPLDWPPLSAGAQDTDHDVP